MQPAIIISNEVRATGRVRVRRWRVLKSGIHVPVDEWIEQNKVVNVGLNALRDALADGTGLQLTHFALGTDGTAPSASDTALGTEVFRNQLTDTIKNTAQVQFDYFLQSGEANGNTLREAGLFTAPSGGSMGARIALSSEIAKTQDEAYSFAWTISFSST